MNSVALSDRVLVLTLQDGADSDRLAALLSGDGGRVVLHAASIAQALALAGQGAIALCVVDAGYPQPDGGAVVAAVRDLAGRMPVLVLAPDQADTPFPAAACYQAGAADVMAAALAPFALAAKADRFIEAARRGHQQAGAERALRDARSQLDSTATVGGLAMWNWDPQRDRIVADGAMRFLFNVGIELADGAPLATYLKAIHPDDAMRMRADIDRALASGQPYESDLRVLAADGCYHHIVAHGEVVAGADGMPALLRGAVRDVSSAHIAQQALDASEARYRTLFEAVDEGVCIIEMLWDEHGEPVDYRFIDTNAAFVRHTGLANAVGRTALEMVPGLDPSWMRLYGAIARSGEPVRYQNDSAGAINRWFDVYATRVGGPGSDQVAVLFTDISERKKAQFELERVADDLAAANRRKNEFIATLAHELRNPLAPLRSGLPLLRLGGDDPALRERVLGTMERQLGHMVELVDDLLDVGRITHGQISLKRADVDLAQIVAAAADAAAPVIEARKHRLLIEMAAPPLHVHSDATRLVQVLNNLLNNAARYTPDGGQLRVSVRREDDSAVIEVADNGVGIDGAELAEVFDLFNRVGRGRFPDQAGLGIGLSLVRSLVELHGGTVQAASAGIDQGSTFTVRLPLAPGAPAPVAKPAAPTVSIGHPVRVLVVDDNSDAADILAELLDMLGHSTQVANSGAAALEAMNDFRPQVVLLDLGMPGMNGYQVAEAIRNNRRFDQPLLAAQTRWGGQQDREQTRAAGFDLHLTKPVDLAAIEKVLASV
jgi:signal transduction histidine kinase/DNA-binding response OmpR family regulator